jgi:RhtB (resistance to homoserine/threonine) family protein
VDSTLLTVMILGVLAVLSPGPNWAITIRNSLAYSRAAGLYTAVGMALGSLIHITYCLIGIGVIISKSILLFHTIKLIGGLYLIYIGFKALLSRKKQELNCAYAQRSVDKANKKAFISGFLTDLLNPKATLFYLALFTQVISPSTPIVLQSIYGLIVVAIEISWYSFMAIFLTHQSIKNRFLSFSHLLEKTTGVILIGLGMKLAFSKN